jgi:hypothetical protein
MSAMLRYLKENGRDTAGMNNVVQKKSKTNIANMKCREAFHRSYLPGVDSELLNLPLYRPFVKYTNHMQIHP